MNRNLKKHLKKIGFAFLCSALSFGLSHAVYIWSTPKNLAVGGKTPIAYTQKVSSDVSRRPLKKTLWNEVSSGEPVYSGEALRTGPGSEVEIVFVEGQRKLQLEADTMVVLSQNENRIGLDLIDGNIQVAAGTNDAPGAKDSGLTLKSDKGDIDLSRATASISKSDKSIDLQVIKGEATFENGGQKKTIGAGNSQNLGAAGSLESFKLLDPAPDKIIYQVRGDEKPIQFKWEGLPKGSDTELRIGRDRKNLNAESEKIKEENGSQLTNSKLKSGKHFFQVNILGTDKKQIGASPVYKIEIVTLDPPFLVSPSSGEIILNEESPSKINFQWSSILGVTTTALEVAKDASFKNLVFKEQKDQAFSELQKTLPEGKYFWRVSTLHTSSGMTTSSKVVGFEIKLKSKINVQLTWESSGPTKSYYVKEPIVRAHWKCDKPDAVATYNLKYARSLEALKNSDPSQTESVTSKTTTSDIPVKQAGDWFAQVEAVDKAGQILGVSEIHQFEVLELPLLAAPQIQPESGDLLANKKGDFELNWEQLKGATDYTVTLRNPKGEEVKSGKFQKTNTRLTRLMPGQYTIEIFAVDEHGRRSPTSIPRKVLVPDTSGLSAPKLKKVKVN